MKKTSSAVWRFFDRVEENKRCVGVLCKLCDTQYKYFGNTTNLRTHLHNKHPIQWELSQNGTLDESTFRVYDDESTNHSAATPRQPRRLTKSYRDKNVRYSVSLVLDKNSDNQKSEEEPSMPHIEIQRVDVLETSEPENDHQDNEDNDAAIHIVQQMQDARGSDEEWLEDETYHTTHIEMYEPKHKKPKYRKIKREVITPPRRMSKYVNIIPSTKSERQSERIVIDESPKRDEYTIFGEYVANKLRKIKVPRTRNNIQQIIATIFWQSDYGMYEDPESVKKMLLYTIQEPEQIQQIEIQNPQTQSQMIIIEKNNDDEPNQSNTMENITMS